jgi:hypothetical protein
MPIDVKMLGGINDRRVAVGMLFFTFCVCHCFVS